jgi:hypothetical protein
LHEKFWIKLNKFWKHTSHPYDDFDFNPTYFTKKKGSKNSQKAIYKIQRWPGANCSRKNLLLYVFFNFSIDLLTLIITGTPNFFWSRLSLQWFMSIKLNCPPKSEECQKSSTFYKKKPYLTGDSSPDPLGLQSVVCSLQSVVCSL